MKNGRQQFAKTSSDVNNTSFADIDVNNLFKIRLKQGLSQWEAVTYVT